MNWEQNLTKAIHYPWACWLGWHSYRWATPYAGYDGAPIWIFQAGHCQKCGKVKIEKRGPAHAFKRGEQVLCDAEINLDG